MTFNTNTAWREFHPRLRRYVNARIGNRADAEDILQDVFLRVHQRLDSLRSEENLRAWIFRVAHNAVIDHLRRRGPETPADGAEPASHNSAHTSSSHDLTPCLGPAMDQLPKNYRQALQLTDLGGLTQKAAADVLDLSFSGMKSRVQRGREKLKSLLEDCCDIEVDRYGNVLNRSPRATSLNRAGPRGPEAQPCPWDCS
jgi:RNA polymerase sigma-70 factor (ECF subfamily)